MANLVTSHPVYRRARRRTKWLRVRASYHAHDRLLGNRTAARQFAAAPPALDPVQERVVGDLRRDGIALVPFAELVHDEALWRSLAGDIGAFASSAAAEAPVEGSARNKDDFLIRRFRRLARERKAAGIRPAAPAFDVSDPWMRLAVSPAILNIANTYRGLWTKVLDLDQWYTVPRGDADARVGSQRWHRDPEDQHVLKVFLYFNDIDDEAGPFQYIAGSAEGARYGHLWPWRVIGETYPPQDELAAKIPESEYVTARGPEATLIFCDTSGFHRGGFARTRPRIMSYLTYTSPASLLSNRQKRSFVVEPAANGGLSAAQRYALS